MGIDTKPLALREKDLALLRGEVSGLIESGAVWLFFPHGVGHLVGLGVRDAGGILPDRRDSPPPYPNLRIDLPLEPGFAVTVEPGGEFALKGIRHPLAAYNVLATDTGN